ncbi:MAG: hypothetical protein K9M84_11525 [Spirochaetia bacterium]|nr:hypothetical protein [Spirochaetia bacterium]
MKLFINPPPADTSSPHLWDLDLYAYVAYLAGQMTLIRDMRSHQVDHSQYLLWNRSPELKAHMTVYTIPRHKGFAVHRLDEYYNTDTLLIHCLSF